jgi:hypothetical protein
MTIMRLNKIEGELDSLRARSASLRPRELIDIAKKLGRYRSNQGKEPTFVSDGIPGRPITIPAHKTLKRGTALNILGQLENDIFYLREQLNKTNAKNGHD